MRIRRVFTEDGDKKTVDEFIDVFDTTELEKRVGKRVKFDGRIWSWQFYGPSSDPAIEQELVYTPASTYEIDLGYDEEISPLHPWWGVGKIGFKCDCGAEASKQPGHSFWCSIADKKTW